MVAFTDFLANNYLWFLVIALILVFSLIGYFVDQAEQKKGVSMLVKRKEIEKDIHDLALNAENKSLNAAVSDTMRYGNNIDYQETVTNITEANQNTIMDMSQINQTSNSQEVNPVGFDVLTK